MRADLHGLIAEAEALCRAIAPDLDGLQVYICPESTVRSGMLREYTGIAGRTLDLALRRHLGERWRGRGFCTLVNDFVVNDRIEFLAVVVHELTHFVAEFAEGVRQSQADDDEDFARESLAYTRSFVGTSRSALDVEVFAGWEKESYVTHGGDYLRALAHLWYRAELTGYCLPGPALLSHAHRRGPMMYRRTLEGELELRDFKPLWSGGELAFMAKLPMARILKQPPPVAFTELLRADDQAFEEYLGELKGAISMNETQSVSEGIEPQTQETQTMNPIETAKALVGKLTARKVTRIATYKELVSDVANGKRPTVEQVERALAEAGKTGADLEADVASNVRRRQLQATVVAAKGAEAELEDIFGKLKKFETAFNEGVEALALEHDAAVFPLLQRQREVQELQRAAVAATDELRRAPWPPEFQQQWDNLRQREKNLEAQRQTAQRGIDWHRGMALSARGRARFGEWAGNHNSEEAEAADKLAATVENAAQGIDQELRQLAAEKLALDEKRLQEA